MKGATAVPCVKMRSPPNIASTMIIGSNQNFFRAFIKANSSRKKDISYVPKIDFALIAEKVVHSLFGSNRN